MYAQYVIDQKKIDSLTNHACYIQYGEKQSRSKSKYKDSILEKVKSYLPKKGRNLDMNEINNHMFPIKNNEFDIFISHSHNDDEKVKALVGFLEKEFNLKCFVDSWEWGHYSQLLYHIDNIYCKKRNGYYDYKTRNITTALLQISLVVSLQKIMDDIECAIFLKTDNSIIENINGIGTDTSKKATIHTRSVWIYAENMAMQLLKTNKPKRKKISVEANLAEDSAYGSRYINPLPFNAFFNMNLKNIEEIDFSFLNRMRDCFRNSPSKTKYDFLDTLYAEKPEGVRAKK
ncbi:toll/interleukin-1 receptor domain-containing protein [Bombella sp. ESL0385]|uniref:toll/interleukin-1 receptor domain-containing protein n=1 Tax=Bombella sp. ESL0385 TaxID=2676446 RepID=UPI0012D94091|nr:toll/interleukin-1 receptor domain-containing protein [Bombella sp. ESL0385]MUG90140.1 hypothetical protein [Bombella sp. ESL0385]